VQFAGRPGAAMPKPTSWGCCAERDGTIVKNVIIITAIKKAEIFKVRRIVLSPGNEQKL
jgi:hypothetical protein